MAALNDQLPTVNVVVSSVLCEFSKRRLTSNVCQTQIHLVTKSLKELWKRVFGEENLITDRAIKLKIQREMLKYDREVNKTKFNLLNYQQWRLNNCGLFDILKKNAEIDEAMHRFYMDQSTTRLLYCSDHLFEFHSHTNQPMDVDDDNESDENRNDSEHNSDYENETEDEEHNDQDDKELYMKTRKGKIFKKENELVEKYPEVALRPKSRNFSMSVHKTLIKVLSQTGINIDQARKGFMIISNEHFGQNYELGVDFVEGRPSNKNDYSKYSNIIPSWPTINTQRHKYALSKFCQF